MLEWLEFADFRILSGGLQVLVPMFPFSEHTCLRNDGVSVGPGSCHRFTVSRLQVLFAFFCLRVRLCGHGSLTVAGQAMQVQFGLPAGGPCCAEVLVLQQRPFSLFEEAGNLSFGHLQPRCCTKCRQSSTGSVVVTATCFHVDTFSKHKKNKIDFDEEKKKNH